MAGNPVSELIPEATALPPWNASSATFRAAVYSVPEDVWLYGRDMDGDPDAKIRVSDMYPGTRFLVHGGSDARRRWQVLLTCGESGHFAVSRAPAAPPDGV